MSKSGYGVANAGPFQNLQSGGYWSGTEYAPNISNFAWGFETAYGNQNSIYVDNGNYALAVHPGDVGPAPGVPEPGTLGLLAIGLLGLGLARRRGGQ